MGGCARGMGSLLVGDGGVDEVEGVSPPLRTFTEVCGFPLTTT